MQEKTLSIRATNQCLFSESSTIVSNDTFWSSDIFQANVSLRAHTHCMSPIFTEKYQKESRQHRMSQHGSRVSNKTALQNMHFISKVLTVPGSKLCPVQPKTDCVTGPRYTPLYKVGPPRSPHCQLATRHVSVPEKKSRERRFCVLRLSFSALACGVASEQCL